MAYLKPPVFVQRVFNPIAMRLGIGGSKALSVRGRTTGELQRIPVIPIEHEGARYIVSTRGESQWVRNVRAAGSVDVGATTFRATELAVDERAPVIATYRAVAGKTVETYFTQLPNAEDHPVFRLDA
jgi:hypothetical protein